MILNEEYKKRLKELSGIIVCDNCFHSCEKEKEDKNPYLCHTCGYDSENKKFNIEELKKWMIDKYGSLDEAWSQKYKNSINCNNPKGFSQKAHCASKKNKKSVKENVGPKSTDNYSVSNIYMDIFNQIFNSEDFKKEYNPEEDRFWFDSNYDVKTQKTFSDKADETADENDLNKSEVKYLSKKFNKSKRDYNWKNFPNLKNNSF